MSDKPDHIIEIPYSLGRDVDRYREGKLKSTIPVEAFMSEQAVSQVEQQTAAAAQPVHAEDLTPISRSEAGRRTTFDGETLPAMPATRRVIPAPFRRPRIDISHHGRTWQSCPAGEIEPGDTVPDVGLVTAARTKITYETIAGIPDVATGMTVILTGAGGIERAYASHEQIRAHRKAE